MAKFYGPIGYATLTEIRPGVSDEIINEKFYSGDSIKVSRRMVSTNQVLDDIVISNIISIVADPFANEHIFAMRYVGFQGAKWKITNVDVQRPRLILTIGGLYNEP